MTAYLMRRLLLLPLTLFCIILVNFGVINLAPGDPVTVSTISAEGEATRKADTVFAFGRDDRYLQFREFYGLTLPIFFNTWPWISLKSVQEALWQLVTHKEDSKSTEEMSVKDYDALRTLVGDKARFVMPKLLKILMDSKELISERRMAMRFFVRGGSRQAYVGASLTSEQKSVNREIAADNNFLRELLEFSGKGGEEFEIAAIEAHNWYAENVVKREFEPSGWQKISIFFFETRFFRYMSRVLTLDFGVMRNDSNKSVITEVVKRFKYSLTLSLLPMAVTFVLYQIFGLTMAFWHNRWPDYTLNVFFLTLYALPIFVVVPFLIEEIALHHTFPFTNIPIPISGFTSSESIYQQQTSWGRLMDTLRHISLPLIAVMYGSLAAQARLSRTAVLEVLRQDFVRTARAKGASPSDLVIHHVGRNASITIVTALAGSLGVVLGGSLIVETLFEIDGFGKFFYDAVVNRDYNVIMFSALAGSFIALIGYLLADIAYTLLDPRITLEEK